MAKTYKTADAAKAAYKVKKATPKGGGKGAKGINLYVPVKQSTIDGIKKMGMSAALKKAGSSKNAEFVQGVKRMYGANRLKAAMKANKPAAKSPDAARAAAAKKPVVKAVAKSADEARASATKKVSTKKPTASAPKYTYRNPKPMGNKGLFPGLLGGKK